MILHYDTHCTQSCIWKLKAMHECTCTHTQELQIMCLLKIQNKRKEGLHVIFVLSQGKLSTTAFVLQCLKVSIGVKGIQIRLQQLKAEGVLLLK